MDNWYSTGTYSAFKIHIVSLKFIHRIATPPHLETCCRTIWETFQIGETFRTLVRNKLEQKSFHLISMTIPFYTHLTRSPWVKTSLCEEFAYSPCASGVSFWYSGFFSQSKDLHFWLTGISKLSIMCV